jgi:hypothetical protein
MPRPVSKPRIAAPAQPTTFMADERLDRIEAMLTELSKKMDKR